MPQRFELLWARVVESNFVNDEAGAIYLWVETLDDSNRPSLVPRAYVLPYSAALAGKIEAAKSEISQGRHQVGRPTDFGVGGGELIGSNLPSRTGGGPGGDPTAADFSMRSFWAAVHHPSISRLCHRRSCRPTMIPDVGRALGSASALRRRSASFT